MPPSRRDRAVRTLAALRHARQQLERRGWCRPTLDCVWGEGVALTVIGALDTAPDRVASWWARLELNRVLPAGTNLVLFEQDRHTDADDVVRAFRKAERECAELAGITLIEDARSPGAAPASSLRPRTGT